MCYKKYFNRKSTPPPSTSDAEEALWVRANNDIFEALWMREMKCQREKDRSEVSFPLTLVARFKQATQDLTPWEDAWIEDSGNDAIMCLHDCRDNFCFKRFAAKCAKQLKQDAIVVSQRDEEAVRQAMVNYGIPGNGFGESSLMEVDEVF